MNSLIDFVLVYDGAKTESAKYIQINEIIPLENIVWVDSLKELDFARKHLSGVSMVGIDCEWKAIRTKDCFINKVSP